MRAAHTPGPWIARRGTIGTTQYHIAEMMPSAYADMPPGFAPAEEQEANGRLIAEAPAMLEALRAAQSIEDDMVRIGSMLTAEHEQRSIAAAEMRRAILARIDG